MRVFIAGGTGVLGRRIVPALVAEGHDVTVLARSPEKAAAVRVAGGGPVEVSLFDPAALKAAVSGHEVVVNAATSIPPFSRAARTSAWRMNDRIRTEGSKNLVEAAIASDVARYVQESVAFLYVDGGPEWIHEDQAIRPNSITASAVEAENQARRMAEHGRTAIVLRFGTFYGPDSAHTLTALRLARFGLGLTPGPRDGYVSSVSTDDAAAAVVAAATVAPAATYNVADDEPVTRDEFDRVLAHAADRRRLRPIPKGMVRAMGEKLDHVSRSQRVSNQAFRAATNWRPRYPSVREGIALVAGEIRDRGGAQTGEGVK